LSGGSTNHNQIALNISSELNVAFKHQDYRVYIGDVRLWVAQKRIFTYPDVMVIAGAPEYYNNRNDTVTNPQVIIEVLSKTTEGYDREDKFRAYKTLPSFREYLLIDQTELYVEQFVKTDVKRWTLRDYDADDEAISFSTLPIQISLRDLYNKVEFVPAEARN
jgi:Uma2 family endonuclease